MKGKFDGYLLWPFGEKFIFKQEQKCSELTAQNRQKERNKKELFKNGVTLRTAWPLEQSDPKNGVIFTKGGPFRAEVLY